MRRHRQLPDAIVEFSLVPATGINVAGNSLTAPIASPRPASPRGGQNLFAARVFRPIRTPFPVLVSGRSHP